MIYFDKKIISFALLLGIEQHAGTTMDQQARDARAKVPIRPAGALAFRRASASSFAREAVA
jgi:hypothetical protein